MPCVRLSVKIVNEEICFKIHAAGCVLVELKAKSQLDDVHMAQVLNYLRAYKLEVALLINFGSKSMQFKRLVLTDKSINRVDAESA